MPKITKIDQQGLAIIKNRVLQTLKGLEDELGVTFANGKGRYSNGPSGSFEVTFACRAADGTAQTADEIEFRRHANLFGLKPDDYGAQFRHKGVLFKLSKIRLRAPAYPIGAVPVSGVGRGLSLSEEMAASLITQHRARMQTTATRVVAEAMSQ